MVKNFHVQILLSLLALLLARSENKKVDPLSKYPEQENSLEVHTKVIYFNNCQKDYYFVQNDFFLDGCEVGKTRSGVSGSWGHGAKFLFGKLLANKRSLELKNTNINLMSFFAICFLKILTRQARVEILFKDMRSMLGTFLLLEKEDFVYECF